MKLYFVVYDPRTVNYGSGFYNTKNVVAFSDKDKMQSWIDTNGFHYCHQVSKAEARRITVAMYRANRNGRNPNPFSQESVRLLPPPEGVPEAEYDLSVSSDTIFSKLFE